MNKVLISLIFIAVAFFCGYFIGCHDGLWRGAIEYQTCMQNGATGWYVEKNDFNCIF